MCRSLRRDARRLELNLFAILSGIRGEAVAFLLNGVGTPVKDVLCGKSLRALIPNRVWYAPDKTDILPREGLLMVPLLLE